jgi:hypothetical protein
VARIRRAGIETVHEIGTPSARPPRSDGAAGMKPVPAICGTLPAAVRLGLPGQTSALHRNQVQARGSSAAIRARLRHCGSTTSACHTPNRGLCCAACSTADGKPDSRSSPCSRPWRPALAARCLGNHHVFGAGRDHDVKRCQRPSHRLRHGAQIAHAVIHHRHLFGFCHHADCCRIAIE